MRHDGAIELSVQTAIGEIMAEHNPQMADLAFLLAPNPLIEPGREMLFAEGLMAGLRDDWVVSLTCWCRKWNTCSVIY